MFPFQAVQMTQYTRGKTNIASAISVMRSMFKPEFGDRHDAPNFGILVTDGRATLQEDQVKII